MADIPPVSKTLDNVLLADIRELIIEAQKRVARSVNSELVLLYWRIGHRIRKDILKEKRAEYGEQIVPTLSAFLEKEFGRGFGKRNLFRMIRFTEVFPEERIVSTLSAQLTWSHVVEIVGLKDPLPREFYVEMCRLENWDVRTLRKKIGSALYERTALSKKPEELIQKEIQFLREENKLTPDLVFRDPYFLDFLGLKNTYSEKDLEAAILKELEQFILELGVGFTFVERQKRMTIDNEDYYLDLLFYHRKLKRLVAIELKLGKFKATDKGQMELYLRWLEKYEAQSDENPPLGLILCADRSEEHIELLQLDKSGIRVAAYLTDLPPRKMLKQKLHEAMARAKARLISSASEESGKDPKQ